MMQAQFLLDIMGDLPWTTALLTWFYCDSTNFHSDFISAAKQGDQGSAALPYHFVFYLHQSPTSAQSPQPLQSSPVQPAATQQSDALPDGMHKVALTLPPPAREDYAQPDQLPAATQASLGKLLSACGLER